LADCDPIDPSLPKANPDTIQVRRDDVPLPAVIALAIHRAWLTMLKAAKPDPCPKCSREGTIEIFSAKAANGRSIEGIFVYEGTKTLELVNLARSLVEYSRAGKVERERLNREIEHEAKNLSQCTR
jgi:hypothetical protein